MKTIITAIKNVLTTYKKQFTIKVFNRDLSVGSANQMVWLFEATIEPFHVYIVLRPPSFSCSGTQPCKKQYHFQVSVHIVKKLDEKLPKILQQTFIYSSLPFFV